MIDYLEQVSVSDVAAKVFRRANGAIVKRVYVPGGCASSRIAWDAPRWAHEAYLQMGFSRQSSNKLVRVLRDAYRNPNMRDALIAAIEARLVAVFVDMQNIKP